jgi:fructose transport system ATP-binding protein
MNCASPVLEAIGLSKRFGQVSALEEVDLSLHAGEILAVIGDNGAGKSTLIRCLSGATRPDSGRILVDGQVTRFTSPRDARAAGIECCYQDLALSPALNATENFFLGRELRRPGLAGKVLRRLDQRRMGERAATYLAELRVSLPSLRARVESLSGGQRQCIAVARAAAFARHVVILDEPTAALGVKESAMVLDLIGRIRERGLGVILISHNMPHVFALADRIHVARLGRRAALLDPKQVSMNDAVAVMTGAAGTLQRMDAPASTAEQVSAP